MESQTRVSKRAPRQFRNWRVQGNPLALRQPCANPSPTLRQPFANLFCQPLSKPAFCFLSEYGSECFSARLQGFTNYGFLAYFSTSGRATTTTTTQNDIWCNIKIPLVLSRFCIVKLKRGFWCSIWRSTRWGSQLSSSRLGRSLLLKINMGSTARTALRHLVALKRCDS